MIIVPNDDSSDSEDLDLRAQTPRETSMEIPQDEVHKGTGSSEHAKQLRLSIVTVSLQTVLHHFVWHAEGNHKLQSIKRLMPCHFCCLMEDATG